MKSFGTLINELNKTLKAEIRRLEKLKKQHIGVYWSKHLIEICLSNDIMPKHIKINHIFYLCN